MILICVYCLFLVRVETDRTSLSVGVLDTVAETGIAAAVPQPISRRTPVPVDWARATANGKVKRTGTS